MKSFEIVVETKDGLVVHLNRGQTYITSNGQEVTYDQMLKWFLEGSLSQHGFRGYHGIIWQHSRSNNYAARNLSLLAATL